MAGMQISKAADEMERQIGWGLRNDDGIVDLSGNKLFSVEHVVTLAELNAGHTILPAPAGRKLKVVDFFIKFTGTFTTATDIRLSDLASSPVDIVTIVIAQAGDGVYHTRSKGTNTLGAGFMADLTAGKGIQLRKTGSSAAGGTSITVQVMYRVTA